ncbi:MAG TPA: ABC transporter permease [Myxococcota bacterium]
MRHTLAIAGRELRSYFVSPIAYAVLTLWAVIAGFFFVAYVGFYAQMQQVPNPEMLEQLNLNSQIVTPFVQQLWIVVLLLVPGLTMGLFATEKANGTHELYLTSPISITSLVLGKFLAVVAMVSLLVALLGAFIGLLFYFGSPAPELPQTLCTLAALWLVALSYAAVGTLFSALTRSQLIAYFLTVVVLLVVTLVGELAPVASQAAASSSDWVRSVVDGGTSAARWLSSAEHFDQLATGLVSTRGLAYFAFMIGAFLIVTKTAIESVRWR